MIIHFKNKDNPNTIVKIKLPRESEVLEFDVFLARLSPNNKAPNGMDVTINWKASDFDNKGVFYTDANGYKIMKRDIHKAKDYPI